MNTTSTGFNCLHNEMSHFSKQFLIFIRKWFRHTACCNMTLHIIKCRCLWLFSMITTWTIVIDCNLKIDTNYSIRVCVYQNSVVNTHQRIRFDWMDCIRLPMYNKIIKNGQIHSIYSARFDLCWFLISILIILFWYCDAVSIWMHLTYLT